MIISNKLFTGNYDTYQNKVELSGRLNPFVKNNGNMLYWGANPSNNKEPYSNQVIAFDNSTNMGYTKVNENGEFYLLFYKPNGYIYKGNYVPPSINFKMMNSNDYVTVDLHEEKAVNHIPCDNKLCDVNCQHCQSSQEQLYRESNQKYNYGTPYFDSSDQYVVLPGVNIGMEGFANPTTNTLLDTIKQNRNDEMGNIWAGNSATLSVPITAGAKLVGTDAASKRKKQRNEDNSKWPGTNSATLSVPITAGAKLVGTGAATERENTRTEWLNELEEIQEHEREALCGTSDPYKAGYLCLQKIENEIGKDDPKCQKVSDGGCAEYCRCGNSNRFNKTCNICMTDYYLKNKAKAS